MKFSYMMNYIWLTDTSGDADVFGCAIKMDAALEKKNKYFKNTNNLSRPLAHIQKNNVMALQTNIHFSFCLQISALECKNKSYEPI